MSIAQKAVSGAAWSIVTSVGSRALGLAGTLMMMRFLAPNEYGAFSAASVRVMTANQFSTLGTGAYLIVNPKAGRSVTFHATVLHVGLGLIAIGGVWAFGNRLGPSFEAPDLARYLPGLAIATILDRLAYVPERVLLRDLRFRDVSLMRTAGELTFTVVSLGLGVLGWGGMAMVIASLVRSVVKLVLTLARASFREWGEPHRLDWGITKALSVYGITFYLGALSIFASRRWDNLLVSRFFGPGTLGAYNLAYNLADVPAVNIGEQVTDVMMASLSHLDEEQQREALVRTLGLLALVMFPLAVGLGAIAQTLTGVLLQKSWSEVAPMLTLLSVLSIPRPLSGAFFAYMQAQKRPREVTILETVSAITILGLLATVGRHSPAHACVAVGIGFTLRLLFAMVLVSRLDGIPMVRFFSELWAPLVACVPLGLMVWGVRRVFTQLGVGVGVPMLVTEIVLGAVAFIVGALVVAPARCREILTFVRRRVRPA